GSTADAVRAARAFRHVRRGSRPPHAGLGEPDQPLRRGVPHAGDPRRPLDGARLGWGDSDRARARGGALGADAQRGGSRRVEAPDVGPVEFQLAQEQTGDAGAPMDPSSSAARRIRQVEEHIRFENAHDLDGLISTFGTNGFYDDDAPWSERHEGLDGVRSYYETMLRAAPDFHIEVKHRHVAEDCIVLEVELTGTHLGAWRGLPATGRRFDFRLCAVYTFDDQDRLAGERIDDVRTTVLRQLG